MKRILLLLSFLISNCTIFAADMSLTCPQALPSNDPQFCASFKSVAICHCIQSGLPAGKCQNMDMLYRLMISRFGSLEKACEYQHDTSKQVCIDDWNCYRLGGRDSQGRLCSATGNACSN